jgi:uncharacterized protein YbjT (DUF2867 family)
MTGEQGPVHVVGAAGHQGAAVLKHLRALGVEARALFGARDVRRNHERWSGQGASTVRFDQPEELARTLRSASALVLILEDPDTGPAERLRHGQNLVDAAEAAGVGHVVFAAATGPDHHRLSCDVSSEIARYLERSNVPATILRPATFMEEIPWYWLNRFGRELVLTTPFVPTAHLPMVALDDMGALAALAVSRPQDFTGHVLDVAGDTRTPLDVASLLTTGLGEPVRYEEVQVEGVFVYQEASTQVHDIGALRGLYQQLHTLESWLEAGGGLELCRREVGPAPAESARRAA